MSPGRREHLNWTRKCQQIDLWEFLEKRQVEVKSGTKVGGWGAVTVVELFWSLKKEVCTRVTSLPGLGVFPGYGTSTTKARKVPSKPDELVIASVHSGTMPDDWLSKILAN